MLSWLFSSYLQDLSTLKICLSEGNIGWILKLQARTLAEDRGIRCVTLDYEAMRGVVPENTLF